MGDLERLAAAEEDPGLRAATGAGHDRRRRGQAHRAGAGDDDDADERGQGEGQPRLGPEYEPGDEREHGDDEDRGHEHLADPVGQALDRRLRALGMLDERDDPGERRIGPDSRRTEDERPGAIQRGPDHLVTGRLGDRHRLAGEHRLVDGRGPLDDDAVDRHLVARPDSQQIAGLDVLQPHDRFLVAADESGRCRLETDEATDRAGRLGLRPGLEPATEEDEPDDDRRAVEVGLGVEAGLVDDVGEERHEDAVAPGRRRPDGDERVHRRPAVPSRSPGRRVEPPPCPELDDRRRHEDDPVDVLHRDHRLGPEHRDHDREGDTDRDDGLAEDLLGVSRPPGGVGVGGLAECPRRRRFGVRCRLERVPRGFDRGFQLRPTRDLRQVPDRRRLRRQVHDGVRNAGRLLQEAFDAVDAARAGHALDGEGDLDRGRGGRGRRWCVILPGSITGRTLSPDAGQHVRHRRRRRAVGPRPHRGDLDRRRCPRDPRPARGLRRPARAAASVRGRQRDGIPSWIRRSARSRSSWAESAGRSTCRSISRIGRPGTRRSSPRSGRSRGAR